MRESTPKPGDVPEYSDLSEADKQRFYLLVDLVHTGLATTRGCYHPKFRPNQCATVAWSLWVEGVRPKR